jgi:D-alanine-D-alanine ligase
MALTVAVLGGGRSSEHDVSLSSAASVAAGLQTAGHVVRAIVIDRDGLWWEAGFHGGARRAGTEPLAVVPGRGLLGVDVVFPVLHGPFGEDGTVQGLLEILDVPYVGAGVLASAVCMDKVAFKDQMAQAGLPQVDYRAVSRARWRERPREVEAELAALGLPVFVKPARLGSSVGIARVTDPAELPAALNGAFEHDPLAIVEAFAAGVEVECSVLGHSAGPIASEPGEILLAAGEAGWYDYEAKYTPGGMELVVPARITALARERLQTLAVEAFVRAGCDGLARADFFVNGDVVLLNELNTMPGFTETSVYGALFAASGVPYPELLDRLVQLALERHASEHSYSF